MKIFLLKLKCLWYLLRYENFLVVFAKRENEKNVLIHLWQRTDWDDETDLALLSGAKRILERKLNKVTE